MTEVAVFKGGDDAAVGMFRQLGAEKAQAGDKPWLKMTKAGRWIYGPAEIEPDADELWAINPKSIKVGFIGWKGGEVVGEQMFPFLSGNRVDPDTLEPIVSSKNDDGWKEQKSVELKSLDDGVEVLFRTSSKGGMSAFADLGTALAEQIAADPSHPVPVVKLSSDSYKHKQYGEIFTPIFEIVEWRTMDAEPKKERPKLV